jgi:exodeoxyribonuclease VII small subunit
MAPSNESPPAGSPSSGSSGSAAPPAAGEPGFDSVLAQLRGIVEKLEGGNLTLEQSLAAFEEGVRLSRQGARILDAAEQRVDMLMRDEAGPAAVDRAVPFGATGGESDRGNR